MSFSTYTLKNFMCNSFIREKISSRRQIASQMASNI